MITVITLTHNEQYMAPFFMRHYLKFADKIVIYDNSSTDKTLEIINSFSHSRVSVHPYNTQGLLRDDINLYIKNNAYKNEKSDWYIVCDFDEFLYYDLHDINSYLAWCDYKKITLPQIDGYQMIGTRVPSNKTGLLTDRIKYGVRDSYYCKQILFHSSVEINYTIGCHTCEPKGVITYSPKADLKLLHYNWLSKKRGLEKRKNTSNQMSKENLDNGWGAQVFKLEEEAAYYDKAFEESIKVI